MMAAVRIVDYEEWSRRKQTGAQSPKGPAGSVGALGGAPGGIVDVSAPLPSAGPFGPVRPPMPHPSGPRRKTGEDDASAQPREDERIP